MFTLYIISIDTWSEETHNNGKLYQKKEYNQIDIVSKTKPMDKKRKNPYFFYGFKSKKKGKAFCMRHKRLFTSEYSNILL